MNRGSPSEGEGGQSATGTFPHQTSTEQLGNKARGRLSCHTQGVGQRTARALPEVVVVETKQDRPRTQGVVSQHNLYRHQSSLSVYPLPVRALYNVTVPAPEKEGGHRDRAVPVTWTPGSKGKRKGITPSGDPAAVVSRDRLDRYHNGVIPATPCTARPLTMGTISVQPVTPTPDETTVRSDISARAPASNDAARGDGRRPSRRPAPLVCRPRSSDCAGVESSRPSPFPPPR